MADHVIGFAEVHQDVCDFQSTKLLTASGITCGFPCLSSCLVSNNEHYQQEGLVTVSSQIDACRSL